MRISLVYHLKRYMKYFFPLILICIIVTSCTKNSEPNSESINKNVSWEIQTPLSETLTGTGNEFYPIFHSTGTKIIHANHKPGTPTKVSFINDTGKSISVDISFPNTSTGNLRLSQIVMPDGTMDGPFGQHTKYNLVQKWWYEFIFNENMMAWDPWSWEVTISITLDDSFTPENITTIP